MFKDSFHSMESGFCISNTYHRSIFRSEVLALRTSCSADIWTPDQIYCAALGEVRIANHEASPPAYTGTLSQRQSPPYSTSRSLDNFSLALSRAAAEFPKKAFPLSKC